jgi:hypothetical protein
MRLIITVLTVLFLVCALGACSPGGPKPQAEATRSQPTGVTTEAPTAESFKEAISAREAFALAEETAKARNASYQLFEVLGCHAAGPYGEYERDSHLVEGTCVQWLFRYVRPVKPDSYEGFYALDIRVGPNGVLSSEETAYETLARKVPKGDPSAWKIDSTEAIQIAEREGGSAYRAVNPTWDTARFDADPNALMIANLEFYPYWDTDSGKEYPGSQNVLWTVKYPPAGALVFVIDAATGEIVLKRP